MVVVVVVVVDDDDVLVIVEITGSADGVGRRGGTRFHSCVVVWHGLMGFGPRETCDQ